VLELKRIFQLHFDKSTIGTLQNKYRRPCLIACEFHVRAWPSQLYSESHTTLADMEKQPNYCSLLPIYHILQHSAIQSRDIIRREEDSREAKRIVSINH